MFTFRFLCIVSLFFIFGGCTEKSPAPAQAGSVLQPSTIHALELIPAGWEVLEDVEPTPSMDVAKLKFRPLLKNWEDYVSGYVMRERAVQLRGNLGLSDAKQMLDNQDKILVALRGEYIVFPGTKLRDSNGRIRVPYIFFGGGRWVLSFRWLDDRFYGPDRFACSE